MSESLKNFGLTGFQTLTNSETLILVQILCALLPYKHFLKKIGCIIQRVTADNYSILFKQLLSQPAVSMKWPMHWHKQSLLHFCHHHKCTFISVNSCMSLLVTSQLWVFMFVSCYGVIKYWTMHFLLKVTSKERSVMAKGKSKVGPLLN